MPKKTRSIVLEVPERTLALLESIAEREHVTLRAFLQQRVADLAQYVINQREAKRLAEAARESGEEEAPGQYL